MAEKNYIIENSFLAVNIKTERSKIKEFSLLNKRTDEILSGAEGSELFAVNFCGVLLGEKVKASNLKIKEVVSEKFENGERMILCFAPCKVRGGKVGFALIYELLQDDWFIRKHLEFSCESDCKAVLDYVDYAPLMIDSSMITSCLPEQKKSHISGFALSLGQPVFFGSAFLGCEFPITVNSIKDGAVCVKYYSGKPISELLDENGVYSCVKAVAGVARSDDEMQLRQAFFSYIDTISKPLKLRRQYNSWYDHMLNISAENIERSFLEVEKGMTAVGSKPLDCFVVDDGWNDYTKDFWHFNSKFPNELYPSAQLTEALGSSFGLWLGPRGGYTTDTVKFAKRIESGMNGYLNRRSSDIDVGSDKYISKTKALMLDFQKRFDLTYWKLDGFILKPCKNKSHDHITGGKDNMYYYSETWAKWIDVFDSLQKASENRVFINLTSYAPPSPWFLQWVNCVWIQISNDCGMIKKGADGKKINASQKDMLLSYRDEKYYDFYQERKFCFPKSRIYNHDPIYGNEAKISLTDDEFREYLFTMAARGSSFWELYYSYELMNEAKWRISESALLFVEENLKLLKNSVMFGGRPSLEQVYGYSCFDENEGIIMLKNPSSKSLNYIFAFDGRHGVSKNLKGAKAIQILPYSTEGETGSFSFGDTLNVQLAPYQTKILHFGKKIKVLDVVYAKARSKNTLEVMFNQTVITDNVTCKENKIVSSKLLDDYRTVMFTFEKDFDARNSLTIGSIKDVLLLESERTVKFDFHENYLIKDGIIRGNTDFTIIATTGGEADGVLYEQGDEIELKCENESYIFTVGGVTLKSKASSKDVVQVTAVRERNGMLKLYLNKRLDSGVYPPSRPYMLLGEEVSFFDAGRVRVLDRALAYDEV